MVVTLILACLLTVVLVGNPSWMLKPLTEAAQQLAQEDLPLLSALARAMRADDLTASAAIRAAPVAIKANIEFFPWHKFTQN